MRQQLSIRLASGRGRRGSVFLIVVAILAVLLLMMSALTYNSRMELRASRNFSNQIQARLAVITGMPPFLSNQLTAVSGSVLVTNNASLFQQRFGKSEREPLVMDFTLQSADQAKRKFAEQQGVTAESLGLTETPTPEATLPPGATPTPLPGLALAGPLAVTKVEDESAKINLNALLPMRTKPGQEVLKTIGDIVAEDVAAPRAAPGEESFAAFLTQIFERNHVRAKVAPEQLAKNIIERRYGADGKPGITGVDDNGDTGEGNLAADGHDNNNDLVIDDSNEETMGFTADGIDNNRNGVVDEPEEKADEDGIDNNGNGDVDEPGEGMDDPAEFTADIRLWPRGDDTPYMSLKELMSVEGMTRQVYDLITPYLTVFSVAQPAYLIRSNTGQAEATGLRQIDLNTAPAEEIFNALRNQYPNVPEDFTAQFTVNVLDRRDADDIPTVLQLGSGGKEFTGFEISPRINEVFPATGLEGNGGDGDDGQYIELINPHATSISLSGWRLQGAGGTIMLSGSLAPGGLLVITDDYNDSTDSDPSNIPGQGSLYGLFGTVPLGSQGQIRVESGMSLPDDEGEVSLYNKQGVRVDSLVWSGGKMAGATRGSFQKANALVPHANFGPAEARPATPLRPNLGAADRSRDDVAIMEMIEQLQNHPFRSPLEALLIPVNYDPQSLTPAAAASSSAAGTGTPAVQGNANNVSQTLVLAGLGGTDNFDIRLADMFMPGTPSKRISSLFSSAPISKADPETGRPSINQKQVRTQQLRQTPPSPQGRINLNTAPAAVLASLPGIDQALAWRITWLRYNWLAPDATKTADQIVPVMPKDVTKEPQWWLSLPPLATPRWKSLSDFVNDEELWGTTLTLVERIERIYPFGNMVTFHTLAFKLTAEAKSGTSDAEHVQAAARAERIIAGDRGLTETVSFQLVEPDYGDQDSDVAFGLKTLTNLAEGLNPLAPRQLRAAEASETNGTLPTRKPSSGRYTNDDLKSAAKVRIN